MWEEVVSMSRNLILTACMCLIDHSTRGSIQADSSWGYIVFYRGAYECMTKTNIFSTKMRKANSNTIQCNYLQLSLSIINK